MPRASVVWQVVSGLLLALAIVAVALTIYRRSTSETLITIAPVAQTGAQTVTVFVGGAVNRPGVYTLPRGERVEGAIAAAGGFGPEADQDGINRALLLRDEGQIVVPRKGEPTATPAGPGMVVAAGATPGGGASSVTATPGGLIKVNTAGAEELTRLPGVGEKIAQEIIDYRTANGSFANATALAGVRGISERMVADWADLISFEP